MKISFITKKITLLKLNIKNIYITSKKSFGARTNFNKSIFAKKNNNIEGNIIDVTEYQKEVELNQKIENHKSER